MKDEYNEIYALDYSPSLSYFAYGGNNLVCNIIDMQTNQLVKKIEGFEDSVVYCKFINNFIIVCSIDGHIFLADLINPILMNLKIDEEVSLVKWFNNLLFVCTALGNIYQLEYENELKIENVYMGHPCETTDILYYNNNIYSLCKSCLISHKFMKQGHKINYKIPILEGIAFCMIPGTEIFCICTVNGIYIYKETKMIKEISYDGQPETVVFSEGFFIVGGFCDYLLLINARNNFDCYKYHLESNGIIRLIANKYAVFFATACGYVGTCDIRKDDTVQMFQSTVETIFEMHVYDDIFYVGGLKGHDILSIKGYVEGDQ